MERLSEQIRVAEARTAAAEGGMEEFAAVLSMLESTCSRVENFTISSMQKGEARNRSYVKPLEEQVRTLKKDLDESQNMVKKVHAELVDARRHTQKHIDQFETNYSTQITKLETELRNALVRESHSSRRVEHQEDRILELRAKIASLEEEIVGGDLESTHKVVELTLAVDRLKNSLGVAEAKLSAAEVEIAELKRCD